MLSPFPNRANVWFIWSSVSLSLVNVELTSTDFKESDNALKFFNVGSRPRKVLLILPVNDWMLSDILVIFVFALAMVELTKAGVELKSSKMASIFCELLDRLSRMKNVKVIPAGAALDLA